MRMSIHSVLRQPSRVNHPSQHSRHAMSFNLLASNIARLCCPAVTPRVKPSPTTWNYSYQWQYASEYADLLRRDSGASSLLCKERTLLVRVQLSKKSASHPNCAFADSMSTVMCGAMISLTPCIAPKVERECDLHECAGFNGVNDMITQPNGILAASEGFPLIPTPTKDCHKLVLQPFPKCHLHVH